MDGIHIGVQNRFGDAGIRRRGGGGAIPLQQRHAHRSVSSSEGGDVSSASGTTRDCARAHPNWRGSSTRSRDGQHHAGEHGHEHQNVA